MNAILYRTNLQEHQSLGEIQAGDVTVFTLELPDLNNDGIEGNETGASCIPDGVYKVTKENHHKFGWCYRLHNVPGRQGILIHSGTHYKHTRGCILPGLEQRDITGDGIIDNISSKAALKKLLDQNITQLEVKTV